jgi:predicted lipid-binding transport protein (Tim44 family)
MESFQFIDLIVLAMIAGFILLRLFSVLGRRTGHEPGSDPAASRFPRPGGDAPVEAGAENVVRIPMPRPRRGADIEPAYQGTPLEAGLVKLKAADPSFMVARFLSGAASAFELIVGAFAKKDTDTLKPLLSAEVYGQFASAIQEREDRGETLETEIVVLKPAKIESIEVENNRAQISVRFSSEQVNVVRNAQGAIIEGDKDHVQSVTDIWTFARDLASRDPNWALVATRSVE